jgi:hypothetical protein
MTDVSPAEPPRTDEEYASLRRARYGQLPGQVEPEDQVELVDTDPPREIREPGEPRREWG